MKKSADAARENGEDPVCALFALGAISQNFDEVWPEIEDGMIETAMQLVKVSRGQSRPVERRAVAAQAETKPGKERESLSEDAIEVLRVLRGKKHFGNNVAHVDQIKRRYCKAVQDLERALKGLEKAGVLSYGKNKKAVSLVTGEKARIEAILEAAAGGEEGR